MAIIRYRRGQEREIVRETSNYKDSIFYNQYVRALEVLNVYSENSSDEALKVVAFSGDRGDGKTSCMMSVLEILKGLEDSPLKRPNPEALDFVRQCDADKLIFNKYAITPLIDPSFFDNGHNVLEIVVGQMYSDYCSCSNGDMYSHPKLEEAFQMVKRCLQTMSNANSASSSPNSIENLNTLADAIELKHHMSNLVNHYLDYMGKQILIVSVDDIDLSLTYAYDMCEQIRKYLAIPRCIVCICVKMPQLQQLVSLHFNRELGGNYVYEYWEGEDEHKENPVMGEADIMAKKYLDKLLPVTSRIDMPKAYSLSDDEIEVMGYNKDIPRQKKLSVFILELIFRRTRFLFYNPVGGVSPIIPNNLRELFNLVGLLVSMRSVNDGVRSQKESKEILLMNKQLFKSYFFTVWKERFDIETRIALDTLLNFDFGTSFNREIVKLLTNHFTKRLEKDYEYVDDESSEESDKTKEKPASILYASIVSPKDFGYNITAGDVFYLFSRLEKETLSESGYALLFFLKSFYSIKLYEAYEFITENENEIYPDTLPENRGLTVVDHRFDHTNKLQQLIGGSFFTYVPSDLIPKEGDLHIIEAGGLHNVIQEVKSSFDSILALSDKSAPYSPDELRQITSFDTRLQIMEYFILSIKCSIRMKRKSDRSKSVVQFLSEMRQNVDAFQFKAFSINTGYYLYDVLAPFSNIVNPEFTYKRFELIDDELYDKILNYKASLLATMMRKCNSARTHIVYDDEKRQMYHRLLSVAVIRNAEVLTAIKDNIQIGRYSINKGQIGKLKSFYSDIMKCEMKTHRFSDTDAPYEINFHFLYPINEVVAKTLNLEPTNDFRKLFESIYRQIEPNKTDSKSGVTTKQVLKNTIRLKRSANSVVVEIMKLPDFNDINEVNLKKLIDDTLPAFNAAAIERWVDEHFDNLRDEVAETTNDSPSPVPGNAPAEAAVDSTSGDNTPD